MLTNGGTRLRFAAMFGADRIAGLLVVGLGTLHLIVGRKAFTAPTEPRIWFASAGLLLIVTGLANLAAGRGRSRGAVVTALAGNGSILLMGVMLLAASPALRTEPQTWLLLGIGGWLSYRRLRELSTARP